MKIVLDFDDTIFNTQGLIDEFLDIYKRENFSKEEFRNGYKQVKEKFKDFDLKLISDALYNLRQFNREKVNREINYILNKAGRHVYSDFIDFTRNFKKDDLMLLSYGTTKFQKEKIEKSRIVPLLSEIVITKNDKADDFKNITRKYSDEKIFFIDDRADQVDSVKKEFPQIIILKMERLQGRYIKTKSELADYVVKDFHEAKDIILKSRE